jgi:hypothetical protein
MFLLYSQPNIPNHPQVTLGNCSDLLSEIHLAIVSGVEWIEVPACGSDIVNDFAKKDMLRPDKGYKLKKTADSLKGLTVKLCADENGKCILENRDLEAVKKAVLRYVTRADMKESEIVENVRKAFEEEKVSGWKKMEMMILLLLLLL